MLAHVPGIGEVAVKPATEYKDIHKPHRPFDIPLAPTVYPTEDEFKDPYEYIRKLSQEIGPRYGICKIIPPASWSPKFCLDVAKFRFHTRKQVLSSLGAVTRSANSWAARLTKYHLLATNTAKLEDFAVRGKPVNYYYLKCVVEMLGGYQKVTADQAWPQVCRTLGLLDESDPTDYRNLETVRRVFDRYNRLILPYEQYVNYAIESHLFDDLIQITKQQALQAAVVAAGYPEQQTDEKVEEEAYWEQEQNLLKSARGRKKRPRAASSSSSPMSPPIKRRQSRRNTNNFIDDEDDTESNNTTNYTNNRYPGDGHMSLNNKEQSEDGEDVESDAGQYESCTVCKKPFEEYSSDEEGDEKRSREIECAECDLVYHYDCLGPKLALLPGPVRKRKWYCPRCLLGTGEFYFEEGGNYSLEQFKEFADEFREKFLKKLRLDESSTPQHEIESAVEQYFWSLVNDPSSTVKVEYGADLKCDVKGSGFPLIAERPYDPYSKDSWNLNLFPQSRKSLFHYMKEDISGVTVPWGYVGMMFSAFCWHSEDHYTYSVNYQHLGATKTWYGIPGAAAELFEQATRDLVPELFAKQPDILFQRATMISPTDLQVKRVPFYAVDQRPGEFVITFPKAYHAGFNHGFNYNEAVNYAPPEWVPFGFESMLSYRLQLRPPVFSHEELLVRVAEKDSSRDTAQWLYNPLASMVRQEAVDRRKVRRTYGDSVSVSYTRTKKEDAYQCCVCNTISYLSRVISDNKVYCLNDLPAKPKGEVHFELEYEMAYLKKLCKVLFNTLKDKSQKSTLD
ncbi:hypothetical protein TRVA0_041S01354 [Trichomonascus vanleenenianus]|uniref:histone demethylase n=1 Tax=Trichomonascus vanleenenianus TaxID=2268995 RepID=UPI003EC9FB48